MISVHGKIATLIFMPLGPPKCPSSFQHILLQNLILIAAWMLIGQQSDVMLFKLIFLGYEVSITNYIHPLPTNNSSTECERHKLIDQNVDEEANVALIHHGLLGASPTQPTVAFTMEALEFYHQLRRCQGNISIQTIIKVLCAIHNVRSSSSSIFFISGYIFNNSFKDYLHQSTSKSICKRTRCIFGYSPTGTNTC